MESCRPTGPFKTKEKQINLTKFIYVKAEN